MTDQPQPMAGAKGRVAGYWNQSPCGSRLASLEDPGFLERTAAARYRLEPFIARFACFEEWRGKRVLEVGCGMGADQARFARGQAQTFGVDLTERGCMLTAQRLHHASQTARIVRADAERLPYPDDSFDFVYSWGVIHHSPNTAQAALELRRVLKPGGRLTVMIYNRQSLVVLQAWLLYGLLRGRPWRPVADIAASHLESSGTKVYTRRQAADLFAGLADLRVTPVVTPYDLRYARNRYFPSFLARLVPARLGYFLVIEAQK